MTEPKIKWVKKANMWCKTWFENGTQHQEWISKEALANGRRA